MKTNVDLWLDDSHTLDDPRKYKRLIEKLIYLIINRSDIAFVVDILSRFMHQPREAHWSAAQRILVSSCPGKDLV